MNEILDRIIGSMTCYFVFISFQVDKNYRLKRKRGSDGYWYPRIFLFRCTQSLRLRITFRARVTESWEFESNYWLDNLLFSFSFRFRLEIDEENGGMMEIG